MNKHNQKLLNDVNEAQTVFNLATERLKAAQAAMDELESKQKWDPIEHMTNPDYVFKAPLAELGIAEDLVAKAKKDLEDKNYEKIMRWTYSN